MPRPYNNRLREERARDTRRRVLEVMVEALAEGGEEIPLKKIAERAGVSLRTLHHHFPDQEAREAALADFIDERLPTSDAGPADVHDIVPWVRRATRDFFANETLLRAQLAPGMASRVRQRRKAKRVEALRQALADATGDSDVAYMAAAGIDAMFRAEPLIILRDQHDMTPERVEDVVAWAVEQIVAGVFPSRADATDGGVD